MEYSTDKFFKTIFSNYDASIHGNIYTYNFSKHGLKTSINSFESIDTMVNDLQNNVNFINRDQYFSVNPRINGKKKENIDWVFNFFVDIDYGSKGHKKESKFKSLGEVLDFVEINDVEPTYAISSGHGVHLYFSLEEPVEVTVDNLDRLENINKNLIKLFHGDVGTHAISMILRVPNSYNYKILKNEVKVEVVGASERIYSMSELEEELEHAVPQIFEDDLNELDEKSELITSKVVDDYVNSLPISDRLKQLIISGDITHYESRSEAFQALILGLYEKNISKETIINILETYTIGKVYRESKNKERYLDLALENAQGFTNLTDDQIKDPLFMANAIYRTKDGHYRLNIINFQEFIKDKYNIIFDSYSGLYYKYNGKSYQVMHNKNLNSLCQKELGEYRKIFTISKLKEFTHFYEGGSSIDHEKLDKQNKEYLTLKNGLFNLLTRELTDHTPDIFTTNCLNFSYDESAKCPMWEKFLDEIFESDETTIDLIQKAVGYIFSREIITPAMFMFIGSGANGKSVLLDTVTELLGHENTTSINLQKLTQDEYLYILKDKMINLSHETPSGKVINSDIIKNVVSGEIVSARAKYQNPVLLKLYCKHFISMNTVPQINDFSYGMLRRIYPVEFKRQFKGENDDKFLREKLKTELSGIFNWALKGYQNLVDNDYVFPTNTRIELTKKNILNTNGEFSYDYVKNNLKKCKGLDIKLKDYYASYVDFCNLYGKRPLTMKALKETISGLGFKVGQVSKYNNRVYISNAKVITV